MDSIKTLIPCQFTALSTLAYYCLHKHINGNKNKEDYAQVSAIVHLCALIGIDEQKIAEVRRGNIKGLQNIARFAEPVFYEKDYEFDIYN